VGEGVVVAVVSAEPSGSTRSVQLEAQHRHNAGT
jgi:hypothetical protein